MRAYEDKINPIKEITMAEEQDQTPAWLQDSVAELGKEFVNERKRKRRWGIFFKTIFFLLIIYVVFGRSPAQLDSIKNKNKAHTGLIDVSGPIFAMAQANADNIAKALHDAYESPGLRGIVIRINSPGGSAVQADYAYNEIMRQKKAHPNIKVIAVCSDACVSAAYYIAAAADEIYANQNSMIGSIGVLFNGFGFVGTMEKLGVERRLVTAGKYKGFMDPFSPRNDAEEQRLKAMLANVHKRFEQQVIAGRHGKLKVDETTFSGLIWTAPDTLSMGLIDGYGSAGYVAREVIEAPTIIDYTEKPNYFEKFTKTFGSSISRELSAKLGLHNTLQLQ